ncbi:hypothetical protein BDK92_4665 [Micromonospora pisi]|uniref:Uncharacterized protein n=1 Tax=Micromonospora pisi TaxID=589240 RepID=A0A495JNU2_9ACTN|nr:hypothetical protein [Micromonospora pisi]RKR90295.1 hypothetical protein BDK92_4665 [Micromonospora pisi]
MTQSSGGSRTQAAKQGAAQTGQQVSQAGGQLAQSAAAQGRDVANEASRQARELMGQASAQLKEQAGAQQHRAAEGLRALGNELQAMSERSDQQGVATDLIRHAAGRANQAAQWLDQREPGMVVSEVRDYARRNPGIFLAGAAIAGLLAGRLGKSMRNMQGGDTHAHGDGHRQGGQPGNMSAYQPPDPAQQGVPFDGHEGEMAQGAEASRAVQAQPGGLR